MKSIDDRATAVLLAALSKEIDAKCMELREKQKEAKLKKIFFISCAFILLSFFIQVFFKVINVNFLFAFILYQGLALVFLNPVLTNLNKRGFSK